MKICFDVTLPTGDAWTDVWEFDRWGNMKTTTTIQQTKNEVHAGKGGREMAKAMLECYFKYIANPKAGIVPRIEWTEPTHPNEVVFFLTMQEHARLLYPDYEPVETDQPRRH